MKTSQDRTTHPWTQREVEALRTRLTVSKRMLEAFPESLATPSLLRRVTDKGGADVEAISLTDIVTIGREGDAPFRFPEDRSMSGRHFRVLVARDGTCYAQDLRSRNHLWINGKRVAYRRLVHGDQIHVGNQDFVFHDGKKVDHDSSDF